MIEFLLYLVIVILTNDTFNINIICYSTDSTDDEMEGKL